MMYMPDPTKYCPVCYDVGAYTINQWWGEEPVICNCPTGMYYWDIEMVLQDEEERREVLDRMSPSGLFF